MAELDAQIGLTADASGVEAGVGRAKKSLASLGASATKMGQDVAGAGDKASKALGGLGDGGEKSAKKIERDTKSMQSSIQRYIATLEAGSKDSRKYWEQMADFKGVDKNALRPLLDQLDRVTAKTKETESAANRLGGSFTTLRAAASVAIGSVVVQSAAQAATALYEASVQAERLRIMLDFSSARGSVREIAYLRTITSELGLAFGSTATAYSQFQAAARGTALEGEKSRAVFESIAKASAVMGLSAEQSSGVLLALQQMISKGTVQAEELRGQLGERLPGAFQIAARAMGVTTAELGKMLEQGQVIADDFLPKFAKALNESLGDSAEKAANRLDAATNRFSTAWERLKQNAGDSGISKFWAGQINILTDGMNDVSNSMDMARLSGSGFIGQMKAGAGAVLAFANPLNAFSYSAQDLGIKLRDAEKELEALKQAGAERSSNLMLREAFAHAQRLVDKYREAKAAQNALLGVEAEQDPRDQSNFKPRGASYQDYARQQADSEKALIEVRMRAAGVNKQYLADLKTYQDALKLGTMDHAQYIKAVSDLATTTYKSSAAGKEAEKGLKSGASEAKKAAAEYQNLITSINERISAQTQELSQSGKLTESQKIAIKLQEEMASGKVKLTAAQQAEIDGRLQVLRGLEQEVKQRQLALQAFAEYLSTQEELNADYVAQSKAREAGRQAVSDYSRGIDEANDALKYELSLMGLGEQARNVAIEQYRIELDLKKQIAAVNKNEGFTQADRDEEIARLTAAAAIAKANASSKVFLDDWKRSVQQYDDIFRQGFADMLNNGKDGWKSFTRSLVTTFKTTVADQIYKMFAQPFVVNIVGNLLGVTGGGAGGAAMQMASGGGGGIMGMASNASSAYSLLTGGATGAAIASSLGSAAISLGNLIGSSAVTSFGAGMAGATLAPGLMGPTTIGATGAMGAGAGLGSTLAAIPGWGWALAGIGALFGGDIVSGLFGRKHEQRNLQGTFGGDSGFEGRWEDYYKGGLLRRSKSVYTPLDEETRSGLGGQFVAMRSATAAMAETLGLGTSAISNFTTSVNIKLKGLSAEEAQKKIQEEFDKIAETLAGTALGTDRFTRSGESSVQTLTRLSSSITAVNSVLEHLNGTFFAASLAGADMASQLVDLFGDAGAFTNATAGYFQNFYSAGEQRQASRTQLERQLAGVGVSMPDIDASNARAQWRALADAQDLTTASGRKTWAMLIQLSGAFAGLTQSIDEVIDKAFSDLRSATNRQLDGLQQQRRAVQESLSLITGIFDLVRSNARELYGEVSDTASMQSAQGMEFVRNALTVARSTGVLPEQDALNEAIQAARSGISQAGYASQFDADFARLSLAGQLSELGDISGRQKTFEEQQLAALDAQSKALQDQLNYWEEQIAILRGTAVATWDIGEAVRNLAAAIGSAKAPASVIPAQPEAIPMPKPVLVEEPAPVQQTYPKDDLTARRILSVSGYGAFGPDYYGSLASWLKKQGISTDQAAYVLGMPRAELLERFASVGIPAFAAGGMHAGGLRVVGERGWELEATGPARIWNQQQISQALQGDSNAEVVAELRAVRAELAQLKSINAATASNTAGLPQMVDQFDNVTEGGNAIRSEVMA